MRSVVVVLPASMCAMIPMLRVFSSGNLRGIDLAGLGGLRRFGAGGQKERAPRARAHYRYLPELRRYVLEVSIRRNPAASGGARVSGSAPEAAPDYSNRRAARRPARTALNTPAAVLAGLGLAGPIIAVVASFSSVIKIEVQGVSHALFTQTGYDRHSVALILLAVFGAAMVLGSLRDARPAMVALVATGLAILLISILGDLPHLDDAGVWPQADSYEDAAASAGAGYYLETLSGVLMILTGIGFLVLRPTRPSV